MIQLICLELLETKYQRKNTKNYYFYEPFYVSLVIESLLRDCQCSLFRISTLEIEDNEILEIQEIARENDENIRELIEVEGNFEMTVDWVSDNLIYGHD